MKANVHPTEQAADKESLTQHIIHQYRFIEAAEIFNALFQAGQLEAAALVRARMDKSQPETHCKCKIVSLPPQP